MPPPFHVAFACGGTPSHLHPGLAVAAHLAERLPNARITFVGTGKAAERHAVRAEGYDYATIPSQPPTHHPLRAVRFVTDNVAGFWASRWLLREQHVSLVVGLGGYSSAAPVRAAAVRGIPTVLLEQNATADRLTRWLARSADVVCAGFKEVCSGLPPQTPVYVTGNPARPEFERLYHRLQSNHVLDFAGPRGPKTEKRLVVIGGANGARSLNQFMPRALSRLGKALDGWRIVHQTGEGQLQETEQRYRAAGVDALVVSYIDQMAPVIFESDLVVCRSGGTTLAELALAGVPAVLVPYPVATGSAQTTNAELIAADGAGTVIDETSLDGTLDQALVERLQPLMTDDDRRRAMAERMRRFARPQASASITETICEILGGGMRRLAA